MEDDDGNDSVTGTLAKVVAANHRSGWVHARLPDGRTMQWTTPEGGNVPDEGEVVLMDGNRWHRADPDAWTSVNSTAVIRAVLEDGTVLIDDGFRVVPIRNPGAVDVAMDNTVEYNEIDGIVRVLAELPIRSVRIPAEPEENAEDFLVKSEGGPTFESFGGYPHVIERARELIETQFSRRDLLDRIGARPVKGILFTGPPGTGKTYLARILASESDAAFYLVSGPSIVSKWVGGSEGTLRRIFETATKSPTGRAIIFFDEIDSIAERRTGDSHEASKRLVAQLLTLMDGFDDKGRGVVIIAATNRADALDPAVTRPGRFDWEIEFGLPTFEDRLHILAVARSGLRTSDHLPLSEIAHATEGWSAARLASLWTEAALIAAGDGRDRIAGEDLSQGFERVAMRRDRETWLEAST